MGPGLGAVALVLLTTKYLLGDGDAAVKLPVMVVSLVLLTIKPVG